MRITRTHIVVGLVVLGVAAGVVYMTRPKPLEVDVDRVTRQAIESTIDADGRTRVRQRFVLTAPVAGRLERIARVEGTLVRAGEVVARLYPVPLDSMALAQARARVEAADALVLQAASQARVTSADLSQRRRELSRAQRLNEAGAIAPQIVEQNQLAVVESEEAARTAEARLHGAEADARQARAVLTSQTGAAVTVVLVRAPVAGRVLRIPERSERVVPAGAIVMEIGDPASLEVVVDVLSSDGATIHANDRVRLDEWTGAETEERAVRLTGRVREVEPSAFTKISALGIEEQRVNVIIDMDTIPRVIGDGFRVDASIVVWSASDVTAIPRSALLQTSGSGAAWNAYVVRDGRAELRELRIGHVGGSRAEVITGVMPGEAVIVFPSDQVREGLRVKARQL